MPMTDPNQMRAFYTRYYTATKNSPAYDAFCHRVFGMNCTQHGFSDISQVNSLLAFLNLKPGDHALDLGCGNGGITAYIAEQTGAHVTGIDIIPEAIRQAKFRYRSRKKYLAFQVMDVADLNFPAESFDALISIDSLYFTDIHITIEGLDQILKPGGKMGIFYTHGVSPSTPLETFDFMTLHPDRTPLAAALQKNDLRYKTWDYTAEDYTHAILKKKVAEDLWYQFKVEDNLFLIENRHGEALGVLSAIEAEAHKRYLYIVMK